MLKTHLKHIHNSLGTGVYYLMPCVNNTYADLFTCHHNWRDVSTNQCKYILYPMSLQNGISTEKRLALNHKCHCIKVMEWEKMVSNLN